MFPERRELRLIQIPAPPRRSERQATVRIREVGICGTDRQIAAFHYGAPAPQNDRLVLGHEAPNGVFILSGMPSPRGPIEIDLDAIMRNIVLKNQVLFGTVNASRRAFEAAVRQLEQFMGLFPDALRKVITHRARLDDVPELLRRPSGIKQVVELAA